MLTYRPQAWDAQTGEIGAFPHLRLLSEHDWGLVIYDEVHLLPAPVFRATAELQARRRLGLTATLVREDGRERDVFSLIGPKKYDRAVARARARRLRGSGRVRRSARRDGRSAPR